MPSAPAMTRDQRLAALAKANKIRIIRAQIKKLVREGEITGSEVLRSQPPEVATMKVDDLLTQIPKIGKQKANSMLRKLHISNTKTVVGLTTRQRNALLDELDGR